MGFGLTAWQTIRAHLGRGERLRIAIIVPTLVEDDATAQAALETARALSAVADWDVTVFANENQIPGFPARVVKHARALARDRSFKAADILIYHFGFYDQLFETLAHGNGHGRLAVVFHNITPLEHLPEWLRPMAESGFAQLRYLTHVDRVWPRSSTNAEVLRAAGMDGTRVKVIEPAVIRPHLACLADKPAPPVRLLNVGRMMKFKGVLELLDAMERVLARTRTPIRLTLIGPPSDRAYADEVRARAATLGAHVEFLGRVDADVLDAQYRAAHVLAVPSYHEGFGLPVIEGLRAGCIPVGYASHHIPHAAAGLGRLVETGNVPALADALISIIEAIEPALAAPDAPLLPLDRGPTSLAVWQDLAGARAAGFSFERFAATLVAEVRELATSRGPADRAASR
jgi:glycosyltransferase involved in cell wall biosynthesis